MLKTASNTTDQVNAIGQIDSPHIDCRGPAIARYFDRLCPRRCLPEFCGLCDIDLPP
jgi:hypothetical protein